MAGGASIQFQSYPESVPRLLEILGLDKELKKHHTIILKPTLKNSLAESTSPKFVEQVLSFCLKHKNPVADVFIAEGADGYETIDLFQELGYKKLAETYAVGLIDLNTAETFDVENNSFLKFQQIKYPRILLNAFVISLPVLREDEETILNLSTSTMLGAFPSPHYTGFFSRKKSKIRKWPIKYSIHDIAMCKMPDFAMIDASEQGKILAGKPLDIDKQAAKIFDMDWRSIPYLKLIDESLERQKERESSKVY